MCLYSFVASQQTFFRLGIVKAGFPSALGLRKRSFRSFYSFRILYLSQNHFVMSVFLDAFYIRFFATVVFSPRHSESKLSLCSRLNENVRFYIRFLCCSRFCINALHGVKRMKRTKRMRIRSRIQFIHSALYCNCQLLVCKNGLVFN